MAKVKKRHGGEEDGVEDVEKGEEQRAEVEVPGAEVGEVGEVKKLLAPMLKKNQSRKPKRPRRGKGNLKIGKNKRMRTCNWVPLLFVYDQHLIDCGQDEVAKSLKPLEKLDKLFKVPESVLSGATKCGPC